MMPITPGRWRQVPWFDGRACIVVGEPEVQLVIARVEDVVGSDDANVICAAPALLAVCEGVLWHIDAVSNDEDLMHRRPAIFAAITAAKGKQ